MIILLIKSPGASIIARSSRMTLSRSVTVFKLSPTRDIKLKARN